ncbi:MAG: M1 family peptidase [Anaerolineales bacterium]|nr:MAG: M1 family peptidase [Anaerolineales bacterium]
MNKRVIIIIIVIAMVVIGLGTGAWLFYRQADTSVAAVVEPISYVGYQFPKSAEEINWEDREIFTTGLTKSALSILEKLPQASSYYISLEIAPDLAYDIKGHQIVRYFNAEDEPLTEIYYRLYPNFQGGKIEVSHLSLDGNAMIPSLESDNTALRVDLTKPLQPGDSLVMEMDFTLSIPTEMGGNYGLYGYFEDVLVLDTFYPMIPSYDESGWYKQTPQDNGDLTYQDASFYIVQVQAPADLTLVSSGVAVDHQTKGDLQSVVFAAGPARDFYLAGSREFVEMNEMVGDVNVRIYTRPEYSINQAFALDYATQSIEILSRRVGEYPYTEFEVLSSPMRALGIEYPGITSIVVDEFVDGVELYGMPSAQMLESTLAHEAGHMWFYNVVGNDQQNEPWVDESLTQYVTYIYYEDRYGDGGGYVDSWKGRWSQVKNADIPIGMPAGEYHGAEYSAIVYGRGPLFFYEVEKDYGLETVLSAIKSYYDEFLWANAGTEDLRAALEGACDCDLGSYFEEWVYGY